MNKFHISIDIDTYPDADKLESWQKELLISAREAAQQAYAPYSQYQVGCAILLENKVVVCGSNQENASFPAGTCAERSALFYAGSQYPGVTIKAVAVTTLFNAVKPVAPCGICRQALVEYEVRQGEPIELLMTHPAGEVWRSKSVAQLLPVFFQYKI